MVLGAVPGGGLSSAGMTNPSKIVNFLDIIGTWSPSLIFVMGSGIPGAAVGFLILKKREKLLVFDDIQVPTYGVIDQRLMIGSVLFDIGWGAPREPINNQCWLRQHAPRDLFHPPYRSTSLYNH
ncbi:hypothetical protein OA099_04155, partial [Litorivicinus sp.]|nr:hypothetical protein [Litorivicinus sp.]